MDSLLDSEQESRGPGAPDPLEENPAEQDHEGGRDEDRRVVPQADLGGDPQASEGQWHVHYVEGVDRLV